MILVRNFEYVVGYICINQTLKTKDQFQSFRNSMNILRILIFKNSKTRSNTNKLDYTDNQLLIFKMKVAYGANPEITITNRGMKHNARIFFLNVKY